MPSNAISQAGPPSLGALRAARERLVHELNEELTTQERGFPINLAAAEPDRSLLDAPHGDQLPGLKRKFLNLERLKETTPSKFAEQPDALAQKLS